MVPKVTNLRKCLFQVRCFSPRNVTLDSDRIEKNLLKVEKLRSCSMHTNVLAGKVRNFETTKRLGWNRQRTWSMLCYKHGDVFASHHDIRFKKCVVESCWHSRGEFWYLSFFISSAPTLEFTHVFSRTCAFWNRQSVQLSSFCFNKVQI